MSFVAVAATTAVATGVGAYSAHQSRKGAEKAADRQAEGIERGQAILREDLSPFTQIGHQAAPSLLDSILGFGRTGVTVDENGNEIPQFGLTGFQEQDPNEILNNPFFQALNRQQAESTIAGRAALGLGGSGGTEDALTRNLLLLGKDFEQQNLQNRLTQNQQRFNQLMGVTGIGQSSAAQTGASGMAAQTDIGALQSVSPLARAQERSSYAGNLLNIGGFAMGGGFGPLGGGGSVLN
jgi:hypothetical protein